MVGGAFFDFEAVQAESRDHDAPRDVSRSGVDAIRVASTSSS